MNLEPKNPPSLGAAHGYSNGVLVPAGARILFVAGQVGWDAEHKFPRGDDAFVAQFARALANVLEVVRSAGGGPESVARMTIYVTDKKLYERKMKEVGRAWRDLFGRWYPAMTLVQVSALLEDEALVELEATCALPGAAS
ncbi:RidA family protein [bacterium]|nr:RidA family protein [bacterium]